MTTPSQELELARLTLGVSGGASLDTDLEFVFDAGACRLRIGRPLRNNVLEEVVVDVERACALRHGVEAIHLSSTVSKYTMFGEACEVKGSIVRRNSEIIWTEWGQDLGEEQHAFAAALLRVAWDLVGTPQGQYALADMSFEAAMELPAIPVLERRTSLLQAEFLWITTEEQACGFEEWLQSVPDEGMVVLQAFNATARMIGVPDLSRLAALTRRSGSTFIHCQPSQVRKFLDAGVPESKLVTDRQTLALLTWRDPPRGRTRRKR